MRATEKEGKGRKGKGREGKGKERKGKERKRIRLSASVE